MLGRGSPLPESGCRIVDSEDSVSEGWLAVSRAASQTAPNQATERKAFHDRYTRQDQGKSSDSLASWLWGCSMCRIPVEVEGKMMKKIGLERPTLANAIHFQDLTSGRGVGFPEALTMGAARRSRGRRCCSGRSGTPRD